MLDGNVFCRDIILRQRLWRSNPLFRVLPASEQIRRRDVTGPQSGAFR